MPKTKVNNVTISYHIIGHHTPIVFIAGLGMDHMSWIYQIPYFQQFNRVILLDNRGMGQSTGSAEQYFISMMADDVAAVLNHLGIKKAHILGNSMGGMIAQEIALSHPEKVKKLVLSSTFSKHPEMIIYLKEGLTKIIRNNTDYEKTEFQPELFSFKPVHSFLLHQVFSHQFLQLHETIISHTLQRFLSQETYVETFLKQLHAIYHHDTLNRLSQINAETLIITGDNDALVPPSCSEILANHIPNSTLKIIPNATHGFHMEQPDRFNDIIHTFLKKK